MEQLCQFRCVGLLPSLLVDWFSCNDHSGYMLTAIKLLHTTIWAFLAASILALPVFWYSVDSVWLRSSP